LTTFIRNVSNKSGGGMNHTEMDQPSPLGAEVTYDGQTYFIGPNERMSLLDDGVANSLVSQSSVRGVGNANATVDFDSGSFSTEGIGTTRS